jgi:hypothetical protein
VANVSEEGNVAGKLVIPTVVLVARVVRDLVVVVVGSMCRIADGPLTMDALHGMCLDVQAVLPLHMRRQLTFCRPEDMFGSLEVDSNGQFVGGNGNYQPSGKASKGIRLDTSS